jgi:hypothetical protein
VEEGRKTFYIFSSDTKMNATRVFWIHKKRREIEWKQRRFHRIAKKELGLDNVQFRSDIANINQIATVCIAYIILCGYEGKWREGKEALREEVERELSMRIRNGRGRNKYEYCKSYLGYANTSLFHGVFL